MSALSQHPTVKRFHELNDAAISRGEFQQHSAQKLDAEWLRQLCREAGADDVGFVDLDPPQLADERGDILRFFPHTKSLISFVLRMNREPIRSPARSVANTEFHQTGDRVNETAHRIVAALGDRGIRAVNPARGFPMEMDHFTFTGDEERQATIVIKNQTLDVKEGHIGKPSLQITADSQRWLGFLAKERNLAWALLRRKIRLKGSPRLLLAFGKCFPS
jgi:hypothetical protein